MNKRTVSLDQFEPTLEDLSVLFKSVKQRMWNSVGPSRAHEIYEHDHNPLDAGSCSIDISHNHKGHGLDNALNAIKAHAKKLGCQNFDHELGNVQKLLIAMHLQAGRDGYNQAKEYLTRNHLEFRYLDIM